MRWEHFNIDQLSPLCTKHDALAGSSSTAPTSIFISQAPALNMKPGSHPAYADMVIRAFMAMDMNQSPHGHGVLAVRNAVGKAATGKVRACTNSMQCSVS
jgi:hypothetical protein